MRLEGEGRATEWLDSPSVHSCAPREDETAAGEGALWGPFFIILFFLVLFFFS